MLVVGEAGRGRRREGEHAYFRNETKYSSNDFINPKSITKVLKFYKLLAKLRYASSSIRYVTYTCC